MERKEEIENELTKMMDVPPDLVQVIAECARIISKVTETSNGDMPAEWLAMNWHTIMTILPQCKTAEVSLKAFRSLRSVALCMHATGFPESQLFIEASAGMLVTVERLNSLESELNSLQGS